MTPPDETETESPTEAETDHGPGAEPRSVADAVATAALDRTPVPPWAIHRRLYDWVLSLAASRHSARALFVLAFAESSVFPIPPDVLLAPLCLGNRRRSFRYASLCTLGSVLGALAGYAIGMFLLHLALHVPGITQDRVDWLAGEFDTRGTWYVFLAALTPIPFKLLTITSGAVHMALVPFLAACVVGRATRFFAVAGACWWLGPRALPFIDRWFNWLCIAFIVLLAGGFMVLRALGH